MKKGYTVIEVVLAMFLASLISMSLFQLLRQVQRGVKRMVNIMEVDAPLMTFYNQVEKDVTGMFAPFTSIEAFAKKDKAASKEKEKKKLPFAPQKEEPKEVRSTRPIEHVFELDVSQGSFFWSFITTGGIQVLDANGDVTPVPFVRRVAYVLEPDREKVGQYRLMYRFSGTQLELSSLKDTNFKPSYELISGIKQLTIELSLLEIAEKEAASSEPLKNKGNGKDTEEKKSIQTVVPSHTITVKEWRAEEMWSKYKTLIPAFIRLSGVRVDPLGAEYPFVIVNKVYAYSPYVEKEKSLFEALEDIAKNIWKK